MDTGEDEFLSGPKSEKHPQGAHFSLAVKKCKKQHNNAFSNLSVTNNLRELELQVQRNLLGKRSLHCFIKIKSQNSVLWVNLHKIIPCCAVFS